MKATHQLIALLLLLACAFAKGSANDSQTLSAKPPASNGRIVTTGLIGLPKGHQARLVLSMARDTRVRVPVELRYLDASGKELAHHRGAIAPGEPFVEALFRKSLDVTGTLLVSTEVRLGPVPRGTNRSCPLHLTLQVVPADDGNGPGYTCSGIDPCLGPLEGPGGHTTVFPFCDSRATLIAP